jgi:type VI secretion system ImpB/VipA family protein
VEILGLAMVENTQHKLNTLRPPRVQITYDVMIGNGVEHKELPFVVGIMSDLSGMRANAPIPLKDRSFVGLYADNFNNIIGLSVFNCFKTGNFMYDTLIYSIVISFIGYFFGG